MWNSQRLRLSAGCPLIVTAAVAFSWAMSGDPGAVPLTDRTLDGVKGNSPNYRQIYGFDYCSGENLTGTQRASYNCAGNLGGTCVRCDGGPTGFSGITSSIYNDNVQPSGGADNPCNWLEMYLSTCARDPSGLYYCLDEGKVDTTTKCGGTYPPFTNQYFGSLQKTRPGLDLAEFTRHTAPAKRAF